MRPSGSNRPASAHHLMQQEMYMPNPTPCSVVGCDGGKSSRRVKGLCQLHYQRWWSFGDPGPAGRIKVRLGPGDCAAEGCDRQRRTKGFCDLHYRRMKRGVHPESKRFKAIPTPADLSTYAAAHRQLRILRGPASDYTCACGVRARQWAYQHNDPDALISELGHPYSFKSLACYAPMCQTCHNLLDRDLDLRTDR